jgi:D-alanine-D-alanine ligase
MERLKIKVAVLFGGKSKEHEISILSGLSIIKNLSPEKYIVYPIFIDKDGKWFYIKSRDIEGDEFLKNKYPLKSILIKEKIFVVEGEEAFGVDVVFPALHGPYGEDGTVQGLLEILGIPYAGCKVLASALAMDKISSKTIFKQNNLPVVPFLGLYYHQWKKERKYITDQVINRIGLPIFVKPSNLGSSIGITKVNEIKKLGDAIETASGYDKRIIIEKGINAREIECSVMGNEDPYASEPGEIVPQREYYDYEAKYNDSRTKLIIPASLTKRQISEVKKLAVAAYLSLNCTGFARVDFLLDKDSNKFYVSEINTIPGFTQYSMFHRLWSLSGISFAEVLDRIINYALEK